MPSHQSPAPRFACSFSIPTNQLNLSIAGVGRLYPPFTQTTIKRLLPISKPAPFGLGEATVYDDKVRRTREIPKSDVLLPKRDNREFFNALAEHVRSGLGLEEGAALTVEFHSLLIYRPGDHFKPHQDTEKGPGMIATVTVILPTNHEGGTLTIYHGGQTMTFTSHGAPRGQLACCAFYADCIHTVEPVTKGYRVAMTFNVSVHKRQLTNVPAEVAYLSRFVPDIEDGLAEQDTYSRGVPTVLYLLDHQYSPANLSWDTLKQGDAATVRALFALAKNLDATAYLVLAKVQETFDAHLPKASRWRRDWDEDSDDVEAIEQGELVLSEVTMSRFLDETGKPLTTGSHTPGTVRMISRIKNQDLTPVERHYEGYHGNWGSTIDYWYQRAGVVFWPRSLHLAKLWRLDPKQAVKWSRQLVKEGTTENIAAQLQGLLDRGLALRDSDAQLLYLALCVPLLVKSNDPRLAISVLKPLGLSLVDEHAIKHAVKLIKHFGTVWLDEWLDEVQNEERRQGSFFHHEFQIVHPDKTAVALKKAGCIGAARKIVELSVRDFLDCLGKMERSCSPATIRKEKKPLCARLKVLVDALKAADSENGLKMLLEGTIPTGVAVSAGDMWSIGEQPVRDITGGSALWSKWKKQVRGHLASRVEKLERVLGTWELPVTLPCSCDCCKELLSFLHAPDQQQLVWPLVQNGRLHVEQQLEWLGLPVTHETLRKGSPHRIVITKTDKAQVEIRREIEDLRNVMETIR